MAYPGYANLQTGTPIYNPAVPYKGPIPGGLKHGTMIFITALVPNNANRFNINLSCGPQKGADVAFHFNPRFEGTNQIVRNWMVRGGWQQEERAGPFPFVWNQTYELIILVQNNAYKVAVNGQHTVEFGHRLQMQLVNTLEIEGDINIQMIRFQDPTPPGGYGVPPAYNPGFPTGAIPPPAGGFLPPPAGAIPPPTGGFLPPPAGAVMPGGWPAGAAPPPMGPSFTYVKFPDNEHHKNYKSVPYVQTIAGGLYPGRMVFVSGIPNPGCDRFSINLMVGPKESDDIAFHFDVRITFGSGKECVRTNRVRGQWGTEEKRAPNFPFFHGANFDICILVEDRGYKVSVNNSHYVEFQHRLKALAQVNTMRIEGGIRLTNVRIQ